MDLATNEEKPHRLREVLQERGGGLVVTPTVIEELQGLAESGSTLTRRRQAARALSCLYQMWRIQPMPLQGVQRGIADEFSKKLRRMGCLPQAEKNDGMILAEASLCGANVLISLDRHMTGIEASLLASVFTSSDLNPVTVLHPADLWNGLKRALDS